MMPDSVDAGTGPRGGRIRVFAATSLDGFLAGPDDDLSWLPEIDPTEIESAEGVVTWEAFMKEVGALLMGRRTLDVLLGFEVDWPYGDRPVLVATHRELPAATPPTVSRVEGPIEELVDRARDAAGGLDVYLDGGTLIGAASEAGLVEELIITVAPTALGAGAPLFGSLSESRPFELMTSVPHPGGMVQLRMVAARAGD